MAGLEEWNLGWIAGALNHTATYPYTWLQGVAYAPALAAVAKALARAGLLLLQTLGLACRWPDLPAPAHSDAAECSQLGDCFVPALATAVGVLNVGLQRCARGAARYLCSRRAPAQVVALVASLSGQATHYPSVTTECIALASGLLEGSGTCLPLYDPGMQCAHSLFQTGHLSASALWDFAQLKASDGVDAASFVWKWGTHRHAILSGLLEGLVSQGSAKALRIAEIGVFHANTSVELLQRFPSLEALLVDPYHLHVESPDSEFRQLDEFYVASRDVFLAATRWTQPFRSRATHVLQQSAVAARWVARGSLDLVFIDGDHRFESVMRDIEAWWPRVRDGGILAGHDFSLTYPGVVEAATKFALALGLHLFLAPELWWVVKPPGGGEWLREGAEVSGQCYL